MNPQPHVAIDGYVDAIPAAGSGLGTARFTLIHSPTDADRIAPDTPDTRSNTSAMRGSPVVQDCCPPRV
ncbi:hypothetical protein [Streptomyces gobitricini]